MAFRCPDDGRITRGAYATDPGTVTHGAFFIASPDRKERNPLKVIADAGVNPDDPTGWEHVSVSLPHRCPTWAEMCRVKDLFWGPDDVVMQLHPTRAEYVDMHPNCLHLWRPVSGTIPAPPRRLV